MATVAGPSSKILRTLTSAVLLDGRGDLELARETRGAPIEWGGVYAQLVRLTGPWRLRLTTEEGESDLPSSATRTSLVGELFESEHRVGPVDLLHRVAPSARPAGAVRSVTARARSPTAVTFASVLEPFLLPVLVEGLRPVSFDIEATARAVRCRHRGFGFTLRSNAPFSRVVVDGAPLVRGKHRGPVRELRTEVGVPLDAGESFELRFEVAGGLEQDRSDRSDSTEPIADPAALALEQEAMDAAWVATTPTMAFEEAPDLAEGYELARSALRRLYTSPGDDLTGLVAGFPWYAAIWARDVAWMLPALTWMGDVEWAGRSVSSVLRFQSLTDVPILGGEAGELPMQVGPGPIFFYGSSDTTLYFPELVARLLRHGLEPARLAAWSVALERALAWGLRRTDPTTGLLRHGGEAAELVAATRSLARVRYGIDALDTTIWDSTDRRDHAIDVQVLWWQALDAADELGLATARGAPRYRDLAERLAATVRSSYLWAEEEYLYDSIRRGSPVAHLRPNALRAVSAGLFAPDLARAIVRRAARDDLSAPWGVRTLSSRDAVYSPTAYHDGQVWPIATAWAADAAFAAGDPELGVSYLRTVARTMGAEGGQANECYRGDRPEPFDSCFLLGLSVGPFLTTLFERLWGLTVDARSPSLEVRPGFPPSWRHASLRRLRIGDGSVDLEYHEGTVRVSWDGPSSLTVRGGAAEAVVPPGGSAELTVGPTPPKTS